MNETGNILAQMRFLQMENVRLTNENASLREYGLFLESENRQIESEVREECRRVIERIEMERDRALERLAEETKKTSSATLRAETAEALLEEAKVALAKRNEDVARLEKQVEEVEPLRDVAAAAGQACMDSKEIIQVINRRVFQRNSDAIRFLNDVIDPDNPMLEESPLGDVVKYVMDVAGRAGRDEKRGKTKEAEKKEPEVPKLPKSRKRDVDPKERLRKFSRRRVYTATVLQEVGIDASNLPKDAKLIRRKDKASGEDVWYIKLFYYTNAKVTCKEYKIGRFNVPGSDPQNSKRPPVIIDGNGVAPSFARFYLDAKFNLDLSENRILTMLKTMKTHIPQSTLNFWMHQVMTVIRERLEPLMLASIRLSHYTSNDATRVLVRSREAEGKPFKYKVEYIHAFLSLERKLVVMLYEEGTRDHGVQEENIFKGSSIKGFVADGGPQYKTIVKDLPEMHLIRQACMFHGHHGLVDAYLVDPRLKPELMLMNYLFRVEREFLKEEDQSPKARLAFRLKWSKPVFDRLIERLKKIRAAGNEYGKMVQKAVNYILDDEEAFRSFLRDGNLDVHNIAIERCFRHIAIGRCNWLHTGSHFSAKNIAFMFGLLESCKLNNLDFGEYSEDILTRFMYGEKVDMSFLPTGYVRRYNDGHDAA